MGNGEPALQIAYSSGFTALSFFVPIAVLMTAFLAIGTNNNNLPSWWRVAIGGTLAGAAICGMHYLGNASISNYVCIYSIPNVVGAALIAVAASITALSLFFVFRAAWTNSWWKRIICAVVLAGAVSGMHWCASTGTNYKLIALSIDGNQLSRNTTVIVVICLSFGACVVMAGTAIYTARILKRYATKAQQVVLATAVFDRQGRVLVSPDGLLPSQKITDSFTDKMSQDPFNVGHPLFQWMFQASRNWSGISALTGRMADHLASLAETPTVNHDGTRSAGVKLVDADGELVPHHNIIFREMFCVAAVSLADKMKIQLPKVGLLWDEILPTGRTIAPAVSARRRQPEHSFEGSQHSGLDGGHPGLSPGVSDEDLAEKGLTRQTTRDDRNDLSRGSLLFLVRRADSHREVEALEAAGFRFAELHQVSGIIRSSMQIKTTDMESKLKNMASYAQESRGLEPGVHVAFFGLKPLVSGRGFEVLVRRGARDLLPSVEIPRARLETWQLEWLRQFDGTTAGNFARAVDSCRREMSSRDALFASEMLHAVDSLRARIDNPVFDAAVLQWRVVQVPCRQRVGSASQSNMAPRMATLVTFQRLMTIHDNIYSSTCQMVPFSLFRVHQLATKDAPDQSSFTRDLHRELALVTNGMPLEKPKAAHMRGKSSLLEHKRLRRSPDHRSTPSSNMPLGDDGDSESIAAVLGRHSTSQGSSSSFKHWKDDETPTTESGFDEQIADNLSAGKTSPPLPVSKAAQSFGGILVSQEITVDVQDAPQGIPSPSGRGVPTPIAGSARQGPTVPPSRPAIASPSSSGASIELQNLPSPSFQGSRVHTGAGVNSTSNVEVERGNGPSQTFADELLKACTAGNHRR
jgi:NO-binding membrane sensor protein with MHYT domain